MGNGGAATTIVDSIVASAATGGELTVLDSAAEPVETLSWAALHERARQFATVLRERGVATGSRVGLLADSTVDAVTAIQAVWLAGAAVTVLSPKLSPSAIGQIASDADVRLVVMQAPMSLAGEASVLALSDWKRQAANAPAASPVRPSPADLAILQYTSGSTRQPSGVPINHAHLAANIAATRIATRHDALHPSRMLSWLPLHHDMGLIGFAALAMTCGCSLYLQSPMAFARRPGSWLLAMSRYRIGMSGGPNFAFAMMNRLLSSKLDVDLSAVRFLLSGAEPIDAAMMAEFAAAGRRHGLDPSALVAGYGLAESTLAVTFSPHGGGVRVDRPSDQAYGHPFVRCGFPVPGTELRIVDGRTGEPAARGVTGHIEIRGPSVVGHYWGQSPPAVHAWFRTGDLGYLTPDNGELVVCGRVKDVLFAAGRNVYPQDIEAAAGSVTGVRTGGVAAFGIPGTHGERLVVAVESGDGNRLLLERGVRLAILEEVGLSPAAVVMLRSGRLPRTTSGKIRRSETRRRFLAGDLL